MPKKQPKKAFSIQSYDNAHYRATDAYAAIVQRLFDRCTDIIAAASVNIDPSKPFTFADYPQVRAVMVKATNQLADNMTSTIETGTRQQWEFANKKCDAFLASIMDTSKLTKSQLEAMQTRSTIGLAAFQNRKVGKDGLNLSQRVWRYVNQYREQIEHALDVGLGEGRDYRQLARDLKANLREPNRLFRRVRDKHGNLQLSKNAAAYHPGTGVYRSSVKNAQRLARSEINMAYREADWQRWQSLDFVIGYEVVRSNWRDDKGREYKCKLCERLKGRYPKTFKFLGWHPQCRCHAIPIMADYFSEDASKDRIARMRAALYGTEYKKYVPKDTVTDLPDGFKEWMEENMEASQDWASTPYFIRDNFKQGNMKNGLLREPRPIDVEAIEQPQMKLSALPDADERAKIKVRCMSLVLPADLYTACKRYGISMEHWDAMADQCANDPENNWHLLDDCDAEQKRLEAECDRRADMDKQTAIDIAQKFENALLEAAKWIDMTKPMAERKKLSIAMIVAKNARWGDYSPIINSSVYRDAYANEIMLAKANWDDMKREANNLITTMNDATQTAKLASLAAEIPTRQRPAYKIADDILKEIERLKATTGGGQPLTDVFDVLTKNKVDHNPVSGFSKQPTEEEIITRLAGGDKTKGSCSSLAFAYAGNKGGMDVLDFRGGASCSCFSSSPNIFKIVEKCGGTVTSHTSDITKAHTMMATMVEGKEYYFTCGAHAAIIRKTATGFEYLELQSPLDNGWKTLNDSVLRYRFGAKKSHSTYGHKYETRDCIIEIGLLQANADYKKLMGYINTASDKQQKGASGTTK